MSHKTIALFLKADESEKNAIHKNINAEFLCLKSDYWYFWEYSDNAMNGQFRRDDFERNLTKYFDFDFEKVTFRYVGSNEYEGEDDDKYSSTTYVIEVNNQLFETINKRLEEDEKIDTFEWKKFEEIENSKPEWKESQLYLIDNAISGKALPSPPKFDNDFLTTVEQIQDAKDQGNLVIFVGSGISKNSGVPMWGELIDELKELIPADERETDYLVIPQLFHNEVGESQYHKVIQNILKHKRVKPDKKLHGSILALNPGHIITTNYDDLIEQAIEENTESINYSFIREDKDLPFAVSPNFLLKMHGDFERKNIVLKEDDYLHYQDNFPLIENFVKGIFSSKLILFIGFSYSDVNLKYIVERVRNVLQKNYQPAYLFDTNKRGKISNQKREYYKKRGVHIINSNSQIEKYLRGKDVYHYIENNDKKKSEHRGQIVYNFLHFIKHYNRSTERVKSLHIIDKMYNALKIYDELPSIPPKFLSKIEPFSLGEKGAEQAEYENWGCHFKTKNERIISLLKKVKIKEGEILFENTTTKSSITSTVNNVEEKLKYIFTKLMSSGVKCIQRKDDNLSGNHYKINLKSSDKCTCPKCRFNRLEIHNLLEDLNVTNIPAIKNIKCKSAL